MNVNDTMGKNISNNKRSNPRRTQLTWKQTKPWIGMAIGRGRAEGWGLRPCPAWFCLAPSLPHPTWWGNLSHPIPAPWGPSKPRSTPVKLFFLLICPTIGTIFLMKPISLIKIYLKLQLNLSHQIKSIFRKNWIIYLSV